MIHLASLRHLGELRADSASHCGSDTRTADLPLLSWTPRLTAFLNMTLVQYNSTSSHFLWFIQIFNPSPCLSWRHFDKRAHYRISENNWSHHRRKQHSPHTKSVPLALTEKNILLSAGRSVPQLGSGKVVTIFCMHSLMIEKDCFTDKKMPCCKQKPRKFFCYKTLSGVFGTSALSGLGFL